jgi:hypothetical protein
MGPTDIVHFLYFATARATIREAEQVASLMVTDALATKRRVEIRDINYPLMAYQGQQLGNVCKKLADTKHLCVELMDALRSSEKEVAFLERLPHMFYRRIRYLKDTVATLQHGGRGGDVSSNSIS